MADEIPYMMQVSNVSDILKRIQEAGTPPKFTYEFLHSTLGFKSSGDRGVIKVLKAMGFLTQDSKPTRRYNEYRSSEQAGRALAQGIREAYPGIFLADESAHQKSSGELKEMFKSISGKGEAVAKKMAATFKAFADHADWSTPPQQEEELPEETEDDEGDEAEDSPRSALSAIQLHHDVHVHLPVTSDVTVYTAIFRAMKDELLD